MDDLAEQTVLEDLLEQSKPPPAPGSEGLHSLLATPFRHPPLRLEAFLVDRRRPRPAA